MAHFNVSQDAWLRWFDTSARVTTLVLRNHLKTSLEPHDARVEHRLERHVLQGRAPALPARLQLSHITHT